MTNVPSTLAGLIKEARPIRDHFVKNGKTKIAAVDEILSGKSGENCASARVTHKLVRGNHDKQDEGGNPNAEEQGEGCNRIYQFGDRTGRTCCGTSDNQETAKTVMQFVIDAPAVGQCFVLIDPATKDGQTLRQDTPVFHASTALLPLKDDFMQLFPTVLPCLPSLADELPSPCFTMSKPDGCRLNW
jgi:hypothetical protein